MLEAVVLNDYDGSWLARIVAAAGSNPQFAPLHAKSVSLMASTNR